MGGECSCSSFSAGTSGRSHCDLPVCRFTKYLVYVSIFFFFFFLRGEEGEYWKIGKVDLTILCIDHHTAASILQERKAAEALEAGRTTSLIVSLLRSGITSDGFGILSDD